jgi:hypothetical protein
MGLGVSLTLLFLAAVRTILVLPAAGFALLTFVLVLLVCLVDDPYLYWIGRCVMALVLTEMMLVSLFAARWMEDVIRCRHAGPGVNDYPGRPTRSQQSSFEFVFDLALFFCTFALVLWLPAEAVRGWSFDLTWPAFWLAGGAATWFLKRLLAERFAAGATIPDRAPGSTPGTPPSSGP